MKINITNSQEKSPSSGGAGEISKILVIQQKMIGDVLTSSILCEALKKKYPSVEVHYLINEHTLAVIEKNPFIDEFVVLTQKNENSLLNFFEFLLKIKREKYDIVIDVYSKPVSVFIAGFSKANFKIGYNKWYSALIYNQVLNYKKKPETIAGLAIENRMNLLQSLDKSFPKSLKPKIYLSKEEILEAKKILHQENLLFERPLFMIGVLGSSEEKSYPLTYLASVLDTVVEETNANLLFNYIPKQIETVEKLFQLCKMKTQQHIHLSIFGKSLRQFIALTYHCDAFLGNEGGAGNISKALSIPTFLIFAPFTKKEAWAIYEDYKNVSVHLADYAPHIYEDYDLKKIKEKPSEFYQRLKPDFFYDKLTDYLRRITS